MDASLQAINSMDRGDMVRRAVKVLDIGYIASLHFVTAFIVSEAIDRMMGKFNKVEADKKSVARLFAEIIVHVCFLGIIVYMLRNLVEIIPFPFDGVHGFSHKRLKELSGGVALTFSLFYFQYHLKSKMDYVAKRVGSHR
jgi:hypothetical protein